MIPTAIAGILRSQRATTTNQYRAFIQAKGRENDLKGTSVSQQDHNENHNVLGGSQSKAHYVFGFGKCLAKYVALDPSFLPAIHADVSFADASTWRLLVDLAGQTRLCQ